MSLEDKRRLTFELLSEAARQIDAISEETHDPKALMDELGADPAGAMNAGVQRALRVEGILTQQIVSGKLMSKTPPADDSKRPEESCNLYGHLDRRPHNCAQGYAAR